MADRRHFENRPGEDPGDEVAMVAMILDSFTSRCSGKEPALLPESTGRVDLTRESDGNRAYDDLRSIFISQIMFSPLDNPTQCTCE